MRAVITGARGFVGPHLAAHLEAQGDVVTGLDFAGPERFDVTDADGVRGHLDAIAPEVRGDTVLIITVTHGADAPLY